MALIDAAGVYHEHAERAGVLPHARERPIRAGAGIGLTAAQAFLSHSASVVLPLRRASVVLPLAATPRMIVNSAL